MQAIVTKWIGPTNFRGARVKAKCQAGTLTMSWRYEWDPEGNHDHAAHLLAAKLGWLDPEHYGRMHGGALPDGTGNCYVFVKGGQ